MQYVVEDTDIHVYAIFHFSSILFSDKKFDHENILIPNKTFPKYGKVPYLFKTLYNKSEF